MNLSVPIPDRLDRLVMGAVLRGFSVVLVAFLVLDWALALLDEMAGTGDDYGLGQALVFVFLTSPRRLWELLPFAALLGTLAGLSVLASRNELVVMRAAGRSLSRIVVAAILPCLALLLPGAVIAEAVMPRAEAEAQARKALTRGGEAALRIRAGFWHRDGDRVTRALALDGGGDLLGITQFDLDGDGRLVRWLEAERAVATTEMVDGRVRWQLEDVVMQKRRNGAWEVSRSPWSFWDSSAAAADLRATALIAPERMALVELRRRTERASSSRERQRYRLAFWKRLARPLDVIALVLLGSGVLFGPLRERGMGMRLSAGVTLGLGFRIVQDLLGPASLVYGLPPLLAVLLPLLGAALLGGWLLVRAASPAGFP